MASDTAVPGNSTSFLESLPTEILLEVVPNLDTHSMRDLLRAYSSFGRLVTVVLGPGHEGNGSPVFFTGFPPSIVRYSILTQDDLSKLNRGHVTLLEIKCALNGPSVLFITHSLKHLKRMSFIHFTGDMKMMMNTCIHTDLSKMHPYAPRTSFQQSFESYYGNNLRRTLHCIALSKYSSVDESQNPQSHELESKKGQVSKPPLVMRATGLSVKTLSFFKKWHRPPHYFTRISIDVPSAETIIQNVPWKHIKQLEIRFYKGDTVPTIQNLDLPLLQSFRIKYFSKIPLIMNIKAGYKSTWVENCFEMLDTSAFDVHHGPSYVGGVGWADIHENRMDLSFTRNFHRFIFVGGSAHLIFKLCNLNKALFLFWYDNCKHVSKTEGESRTKELRERERFLKTSLILPRVKGLCYITGDRNMIDLPYGLVIPKLRIRMLYTTGNMAALKEHVRKYPQVWARY